MLTFWILSWSNGSSLLISIASLALTHQSLLCCLLSAYFLSNFCVFHLLPHSLMSGPVHSLSVSHTHQWLRHASPASLLPLQLHFICCRSSRVAPLNDSVRPVVGVWVLLIMPVSLWGEVYRQIRPEKAEAVAPHHLSWWGPDGPNQTAKRLDVHGPMAALRLHILNFVA